MEVMEILSRVGGCRGGRRMDRHHPRQGGNWSEFWELAPTGTCSPVFLFLRSAFLSLYLLSLLLTSLSLSLSLSLSPKKQASVFPLQSGAPTQITAREHTYMVRVRTEWGCKPATTPSSSSSSLLPAPSLLLIPGQLTVWLASSRSGWRVLLLLSLFGLEAQLHSEAREVPQEHSSHYWSGWDPALSPPSLSTLQFNTWRLFFSPPVPGTRSVFLSWPKPCREKPYLLWSSDFIPSSREYLSHQIQKNMKRNIWKGFNKLWARLLDLHVNWVSTV